MPRAPATVLTRRQLCTYGLLGMPLAFAALPLYVHVPKLYADALGMSLSLVGAVLLGARLLDALVDPVIGWWSDRLGSRKRMIAAAMPLLGIAMLGLLAPRADWVGVTWLAGALAVVYLGFSIAQINYYAWGAEITALHHERTRITAWREGFTLVGVVAAAALPAMFDADLARGLERLAWMFLPLLAFASVISLLAGPPASGVRPQHANLREALSRALANRAFTRLLAVFAFNGIASAVPATLVLFFVADVLQLESLNGLFLVLYFVAGVAALPLWVALSRHVGKGWAWLASMGLACVVFVWAWGIGPGAAISFALICVLSGAALGADLALPPSMLADAIENHERGGTGAESGAYFGIWNLVTKLNLALAAGIALPLLAALGYEPGARDADALASLSFVYALVPVVLKVLAALFLWYGLLRRRG